MSTTCLLLQTLTLLWNSSAFALSPISQSETTDMGATAAGLKPKQERKEKGKKK